MKIVITDGYELNPGDLTWKDIHTLGQVDYFDKTLPGDVNERCAAAQVIVTNKTRIDASTIAGSPGLKLISVTATGYNNMLLQRA